MHITIRANPKEAKHHHSIKTKPKEDEDLEILENEEDSEVPDEDHEVWSCEELYENQAVYSVGSLEGSEDGEMRKWEKQQDKAGWVNVPRGGGDEGEWMKPNDIPTVVKDAAQFFLEAAKKM